MKKIVLGYLLISIPAVSAAMEGGAEIQSYTGTTLAMFEMQDPQLKEVMSQAGWDILWSWIRRPSPEQLSRMRKNVLILKEKLTIIEKTRDQALKKLPPVSTSSRSATNEVLYFLTSLVYLPGMLWREMFTQNPIAAQQKEINQMNAAYARVSERIKALEGIISKYSSR